MNILEKQAEGFYTDKKILIIGGTGSIGERMIDTLLSYNPAVIRILSRDEHKQYMLANKYQGKTSRLRYLIGDIRDFDRLKTACKDIDIIFNLAALKHVPLCEYNPFEAVKTNVYGTQNIITAAINEGVSTIVLTSSDKAISPTNAMGATKLLAERLIIAADSFKGGAPMSFSAVRFGNVLGSRGSVVPFFVNQIRTLGKVTITDTHMTRFMMSLDDAVSLTLNAAAISKGGEIFVLKMPNIKIIDLVTSTIELTCEKYNINPAEIKIEQIGLRPGEKMFEELMTAHELENSYELPNMFAIVPDSYKHKEYFAGVPLANAESSAGYSSDKMQVLSKDEVKKLLIKERLI